MVKSLLCILTIFFSINSIWSDPVTFEKVFGGELEDYGRFVQETPEGGYILLGICESFTSPGNRNLYYMQTDAHGEILTEKIVFMQGDYVQSTCDGGYISILTFKKRNSWIIRLGKADRNFLPVWQKEFEGRWGYSAGATADNGYIVLVGLKNADYEYDVFLRKLNESGEILWEKTFNGIFALGNYYVTQTSDLGYVVAGYRYQKEEDQKTPVFNLIKFDQNGGELWSKEFAEGISGMCVQQTKDGGYIIAGSVDSGSIAGTMSLCLIKTDLQGGIEWQKDFKSDTHQEGIFVQQTSDGGYIITGRTGSAANKDFILIKTNSLGEVNNFTN
jgi:hypothetical protein